MDSELASSLSQWANTYEHKRFILDDPISIPHRYKKHSDIEISAFISAWLAYGNRKAIISTADFIDNNIFCKNPTDFILSFEPFANENDSLYRFYKYGDWNNLCKKLKYIYRNYDNLEQALKDVRITSNPKYKVPYTAIQNLFSGVNGIPNMSSTSACKRLCMFLRWMCRKNSPVDFGIWDIYNTEELLIPLDVHVHSLSIELGLTQRKSADIRTVLQITDSLKEVFPNDPTKGDFALFGYDMYRKNKFSTYKTSDNHTLGFDY